jgi:hypothetical protein
MDAEMSTRQACVVSALAALCACTGPTSSSRSQAMDREQIFVLRSIHEPRAATPGWCDASRTGFEPLASDAERAFSFWSVEVRHQDGMLVDAKRARVAQLRGCFGATNEPARQNFHAEIQLGGISFRGRGECMALLLDVPEPGLIPVRCHLVLSGLPDPFVGGLLTTSTMTSKAALGGDTDPPGYTQASIATIRLWRRPETSSHGDTNEPAQRK